MSSLAARYTDDPDVQPLVEAIIDAGDKLSDERRGEIVEAQGPVGEALVAMSLDVDLASVDAPGGGWAPIHAVRLLGERRQVEAVEPLIEVVATTEADDLLGGAAIFALQEIGAPTLEPILVAIDDEPGLRLRLAEVLSTLEIRDERIVDTLEAVVGDDPQLGASYLATYGDAAGIDVLRDALGDVEFGDDNVDLQTCQRVIDIAVAIESLGGTLGADDRARVERAYSERERVAKGLLDAGLDGDSSGDDDDGWRPSPGSRGSRR